MGAITMGGSIAMFDGYWVVTKIYKDEFESVENDIKCGKHSGFPNCCIKFYTTKWQEILENINNGKPEEHRNYFKKMEEKEKIIGKKIGYIPCPQCLEKENFVEAKDCMCCFELFEKKFKKYFREKIIPIISDKEKSILLVKDYGKTGLMTKNAQICLETKSITFEIDDQRTRFGINYNQEIRRITNKFVKKVKFY